ncbi:hypothetical protein C8Q74DRAFT_1372951 [Fomes fomentarius]|nr:hypothetical protein C8Q74DRAFT_1372951 [Fomes fomentarius]
MAYADSVQRVPRDLSLTSRLPTSLTQSRRGRSLPDPPTLAVAENLFDPSSTVLLANIRGTPQDLLWPLFAHACAQKNLSPPALLRPPLHLPIATDSTLLAVFSTPQDARLALDLSCDLFHLALLSDPEHTSFSHINLPDVDCVERDSLLPRLTVSTLPPARSRPKSSTHDHPTTIMPLDSRGYQPGFLDLVAHRAPAFSIASNPPNTRTSFRVGDWMCASPGCSAHNFQRNTACIACGRPRRMPHPTLPAEAMRFPTFPLVNPSPRFADRYNVTQSTPHSPPASTPSFTTLPSVHPTTHNALAAAQAQMPSKAPPPQYPPLTPSGRALSVGGRVRNISCDPMFPCVMYWPDNEPLPDPSQIRPVDSALITYPPIVNTGNKGAAEKQPGDWICGKCNYHNWRRRKVCQTCFPYAEGNGDSISAAVQAERLALLANVLSTEFNALDLDGMSSPPVSRGPQHRQLTPSSAPPYSTRFVDGPDLSLGNSLHDTPLLLPLALSEHDKISPPIYQTSGDHMHVRLPRLHHPLPTSSPGETTLLPSFLQDIMHSPSQSPSPTSSSSADLSFDGSSEDAHYVLTPGTHPLSSRYGHGLYGASSRKGTGGNNSSYSSLGRSSVASIWKFDGEESKTLSSSSTSSSAQTSPTTAFAQTAYGHAIPVSMSISTAVPIGASPTDSGTTPKGTSGFWRARYN